ncbi:DUF1330 domain-containing protein [Pelomonas cellulosilytica]|uniref:DUF1330 domain-containing protein n=1 Tax=Pelomonas cellulosilytica TaxID=2906762 RepID=A0ABS8XPP9_9BURK|nr:DUF1330 domain-containing protein [Pelomonas sp. P8]MCE4553793.1 DUF1330 domain-containing protein [Pelomonas sp. P8]
MPKAYWIARVDVTDPTLYQRYVDGNAAVFAKYGGRFVVRGGPFDSLEGTSRSRNVVLEFESREAALRCYHSPEYAPQIAIRQASAVTDLILIEGYDGPQPGSQ